MRWPVFEHDVAGLQVAVQQARLVRRRQTFERLAGQHPEVLQREGPARDDGFEGLAVHQFHDDKRPELVRAEVVHRDDVRVLHRRQVDGLAPGAFVKVAVVGLSRRVG